MKNKHSVSLLYFFGFTPLDKLMEDHYQGEDMYVEVYNTEDKLIFEIDDYTIEAKVDSIKFIELQYLESIVLIKIEEEECQFSFEDRISKELLELLFSLKVEKKIPKFLQDRYLQFVENEGLFELVLKLKEDLPPNDYLHFYPFIDEMALTGIVESFAPQAIAEVPLMYIKYIDSEDKELGLLVSSNTLYSPENSISLKDINSIAYDEHFGFSDTILLLVNQQHFSNMNVIIWDKSMTSFSGMYKREFKTDEILKMIVEISNFVIKNNKS